MMAAKTDPANLQTLHERRPSQIRVLNLTVIWPTHSDWQVLSVRGEVLLLWMLIYKTHPKKFRWSLPGPGHDVVVRIVSRQDSWWRLFVSRGTCKMRA